jgi:hypothetical protein
VRQSHEFYESNIKARLAIEKKKNGALKGIQETMEEQRQRNERKGTEAL